jgi:hypothetical protein
MGCVHDKVLVDGPFAQLADKRTAPVRNSDQARRYDRLAARPMEYPNCGSDEGTHEKSAEVHIQLGLDLGPQISSWAARLMLSRPAVRSAIRSTAS